MFSNICLWQFGFAGNQIVNITVSNYLSGDARELVSYDMRSANAIKT